ncbi:MAG: hypothetical protein IKK11_05275 [Oscillospiraceae bacterium]|nr:hypothetical protein [Oscillospiraceae bacterium]
MRQKTNWPKILYIFCWGALLAGLLFTWEIFDRGGFVLHKSSGISPFSQAVVACMMLLLQTMLCYFILMIPRLTRKGPRPTTQAGANLVLLFFAFFVFFFVGAFLLPNPAVRNPVLGIITAGLLIGLILTLAFSDHHSRHFLSLEMHKARTLWCTSLLALALIGVTLWVPGMWGLTIPKIQLPGDLLGYYGAQLSLTFITISVMSVLSDKSVVVYWENIAEAKLIKPLFGSFASYTAYSITATVGAGISALLNNHLAFLVFFTLNIPVLIALTLTMVDVYYGRDGKKKGLEKILQDNAAAYGYCQNLHSIPSNGDLTVSLVSHINEYRSHMFQLEYYLHQAVANHDTPYINELLFLYGQNLHCFTMPEGQRVVSLLHSAIDNPWEIILLSVDNHTSQEEDARNPFDQVLHSNQWNSDAQLWNALSHNTYLQAYLEKLPEHSEIPSVLTWVVMHRMTLLFNDMISSHGDKYTRKRYVTATLHNDWVDFRYDAKTLATAYNGTKDRVMEKDGLLSDLVQLILLILRTEDRQALMHFSRCPFLPLLSDAFRFLGATEEEARLLQDLGAKNESCCKP